MKVKLEIAQKTTYKDYKGEVNDYTDTLHFDFDSFDPAKCLINAFRVSDVADDINMEIVVTLKERNELEDGEEQ